MYQPINRFSVTSKLVPFLFMWNLSKGMAMGKRACRVSSESGRGETMVCYFTKGGKNFFLRNKININ